MVSKQLASGCQLIVTLEWYKALVLGAEKNGSERDEGNDEEEEGEEEEGEEEEGEEEEGEEEEGEEEEGEEEQGEEEDEGEKPPLPRKKDGSVSALILLPSHLATAYWVLRFT